MIMSAFASNSLCATRKMHCMALQVDAAAHASPTHGTRVADVREAKQMAITVRDVLRRDGCGGALHRKGRKAASRGTM